MSLTKITDYMKLSQEDRQKHIDLSTECKFYFYDRDYNKKNKKAGDLYSKNEQMKKAKSALLGFLNIEEFGGREIHVCHLCDCNSGTDKVCVNPAHLYFGTALENRHDIPFEIRSKAGKKAGKIGGKIGGKKTAENMTKEQLSERGKKSGKIGGPKACKKAMENGTQITLQKVKCPYCNKEGSLLNMKHWHFDNCKFKPISETLKDISIIAPETVSINLE